MNSDCGPYKLSGEQRVAQIVAKSVEPYGQRRRDAAEGEDALPTRRELP